MCDISLIIMLEQLSSTQESDFEDDVYTPVDSTRKMRRVHAQPRTSQFRNLIHMELKRHRSQLRQQARDDKYADLTCTY